MVTSSIIFARQRVIIVFLSVSIAELFSGPEIFHASSAGLLHFSSYFSIFSTSEHE